MDERAWGEYEQKENLTCYAPNNSCAIPKCQLILMDNTFLFLFTPFSIGILPYINVTATQDHCCINYTWTQPPTIEGVPVTGYQYNITTCTVDGVLTNTITDTFIQYCPQVFGDYAISH